jgi:hypothetical protein
LLDIRQTLSDKRSTDWQDMERIKTGGCTLILSTQGAFVVFISRAMFALIANCLHLAERPQPGAYKHAYTNSKRFTSRRWRSRQISQSLPANRLELAGIQVYKQHPSGARGAIRPRNIYGRAESF